jgi:hypothetical protein
VADIKVEVNFNFNKFKREIFVPALFRATDDFTASMVVTQSIGYYIYRTAWFARDRLEDHGLQSRFDGSQ